MLCVLYSGHCMHVLFTSNPNDAYVYPPPFVLKIQFPLWHVPANAVCPLRIVVF